MFVRASLLRANAPAADYMPRLEGLSYIAENNAHLMSPPPGGAAGGASGSTPPPPPPRGGGAAGAAPPPPQPQPQMEYGTTQRASATVTGAAPRGKPSLRPLNTAQCTSIIDAMKEGTPQCTQMLTHPRTLTHTPPRYCHVITRIAVYKAKVRPFEEQFKFGNFFSPLLTDADFDGKPQVLLLGQYSTGKTTFIRHLIGREYPGCHIGPEPTTDRFVVVCHGADDRITPGNTLAVQPDKPYSGLSNFGSGFLSKFQASQCCAKLLEEITIVDTPGVLSGEKQRIERSYNFVEVCEWFAARCDVILLLFDPHKLDISDEFKSVIASLRGHDDKVRVVLNKADQIDAQQLLRVYGALMWSLGKARAMRVRGVCVACAGWALCAMHAHVCARAHAHCVPMC